MNIREEIRSSKSRSNFFQREKLGFRNRAGSNAELVDTRFQSETQRALPVGEDEVGAEKKAAKEESVHTGSRRSTTLSPLRMWWWRS